MKKTIALLVIALALLCHFAMSQTVTGPTTTRWANGNEQPGRMIASGSVVWSLTTLESDADSSITTAVIDLPGQTRLASMYIFNFKWASATGGSTTTQLQLTPYWHAEATSTAGASIGATNSVYIGGFTPTGAANALTVLCQATAAGAVPLVIVPNTYGFLSGCVPRYLSFKLDKEGNGKFTAGTATLYWEAYAK